VTVFSAVNWHELLDRGADTVTVNGKGHVEPGITEKGGWEVAGLPSKRRDEAAVNRELEATLSCVLLIVGIESDSTVVIALLGP
jgi:hypothetical protein